jgi:hypothetical protein
MALRNRFSQVIGENDSDFNLENCSINEGKQESSTKQVLASVKQAQFTVIETRNALMAYAALSADRMAKLFHNPVSCTNQFADDDQWQGSDYCPSPIGHSPESYLEVINNKDWTVQSKKESPLVADLINNSDYLFDFNNNFQSLSGEKLLEPSDLMKSLVKGFPDDLINKLGNEIWRKGEVFDPDEFFGRDEIAPTFTNQLMSNSKEQKRKEEIKEGIKSYQKDLDQSTRDICQEDNVFILHHGDGAFDDLMKEKPELFDSRDSDLATRMAWCSLHKDKPMSEAGISSLTKFGLAGMVVGLPLLLVPGVGAGILATSGAAAAGGSFQDLEKAITRRAIVRGGSRISYFDIDELHNSNSNVKSARAMTYVEVALAPLMALDAITLLRQIKNIRPLGTSSTAKLTRVENQNVATQYQSTVNSGSKDFTLGRNIELSPLDEKVSQEINKNLKALLPDGTAANPVGIMAQDQTGNSLVVHALEVLPDSGSPLNNFIRRMGSRTGDARVFIVDEKMMGGSQGFFAPNSNTIFLSSSTFSSTKKASDNTTLLHEFRHAIKDHEIQSGIYNPYHGEMNTVKNSDSIPGLKDSNPYKNYLSFDESQTFRDDGKNMFRKIKELSSSGTNKDEVGSLVDELISFSSLGRENSSALRKNLRKIDDSVIEKNTAFFWNPTPAGNNDYIMSVVTLENNVELTFHMNEFSPEFVKAWNTQNRTPEAVKKVQEALKKRVSDLTKKTTEDINKMDALAHLGGQLKYSTEPNFMINAFESGLNTGKRYSASDSLYIKEAKKIFPESSTESLINNFAEIFEVGEKEIIKNADGKEIVSYRIDDEYLMEDEVSFSLLFSADGQFIGVSP